MSIRSVSSTATARVPHPERRFAAPAFSLVENIGQYDARAKFAARHGEDSVWVTKRINLRLYGVGNDLEQEFVVMPGADPSQIRMRLAGVRGLRIDRDGPLLIGTALGELRQKKPFPYQTIDGKRVEVAANFRRGWIGGRRERRRHIRKGQRLAGLPNHRRRVPNHAFRWPIPASSTWR